MHRRAVAVLAAVVLTGPVSAGCGSDDNGGTVAEPPDDSATTAKMVQVNAVNFGFNPTEVPLTAGDDVQFVITNGDQVKHSLTIKDLDVDQDVEGGKTANAPATEDLKAGTYTFECKYHPAQMQGTVTVT